MKSEDQITVKHKKDNSETEFLYKVLFSKKKIEKKNTMLYENRIKRHCKLCIFHTLPFYLVKVVQ